MADDPQSKALARILERIGGEPDFPSFARQMRTILSGLQRSDSNLNEIGELVLRDYTLSMQVIRASNSALYNRSGRPLQDIKQAIMMLGSRVLRELAGTIVLFEHYKRRSPAVRDILLRSTLTAGHARGLALRAAIDTPETAYLCGMFYNLGELLVAAHFPREYAGILRLRTGVPSQDRFNTRRVLGCDYETIGIVVAREWRLPAEVIGAMQESGPMEDPRTRLVVRMAHELTEAEYRANENDSGDPVERCFLAHGPRLRLSRRDVNDVLKAVADDSRGLFVCAGIGGETLRMTPDRLLAEEHLAAQLEVRLADRSGSSTDRRPSSPL